VADKQKSGRKEPRAQKPSGGNGTAGFDNWLENKLRTAYSSVLDEPIPDDLIELISQKLKD
jgi:Anti-sigma factor NepR